MLELKKDSVDEEHDEVHRRGLGNYVGHANECTALPRETMQSRPRGLGML